VENRLEVFRHLKKCGIESRPLICGNIGQQPFWVKRYGDTRFMNASVVHENGIYLPNHLKLSAEQIDYITEEFARVAVPKFFPD
ncbi:MAG: DegT/DnrJ/EryC1/StrS family aminotransferase, partial [Gammaproteobacteria bacterium]|nr:DegT/DnrJ/EryC1/StrS family aminotransferase [Gammaproteobacteria bacterium]